MSVTPLRRATAVAGLALLACVTAGLALSSPAYAAASGGPESAAASTGTSKVSVVHGIPGQPVDVYVDGKKILDNFKPATVAGPLSLPAGTYDVALTKPGGSADDPLLEDKKVQVPGNKNLSLVAHLSAAGKPALTAYVNDTSALKAGMTRLVVRHDAQAPGVDVRANGKVAFSNLTNPKEAMADLPAGTVSADVVLTGTDTVAIKAQKLDLAAGKATIVYAIGSADDKSLALVAQTISGLGSSPSGMPAGSGGQNATGNSAAGRTLAIAGFAVLSLGVLTLVPRREKARA